MFKSGEHVHPTLPNAMFLREREREREGHMHRAKEKRYRERR